jgi:uncharacterized protein (DUF488 family)
MAKTALFTIGYEGRQLDEFLAILASNKIDRLIDVRELPLSRRRGFSKTPLSKALAEQGIEYVGLREAGNPHHKLKHELSKAQLLVKYRAHLAKTDGVVERVADEARGHRAVLLCYEAEPAECHRSVLAPKVAAKLRCKTTDL